MRPGTSLGQDTGWFKKGTSLFIKKYRRMSSHLKKVVGQGRSRSQKAGSAPTSKKKMHKLVPGGRIQMMCHDQPVEM